MYRKPLKLDDEPLKFEVMFRLALILLRDSKWKPPPSLRVVMVRLAWIPSTSPFRWSVLSRMIPDENFAHCYRLLLPDQLPVEKCQLQLSLVTQTSCLGRSQEERLRRFDLCPLIAD